MGPSPHRNFEIPTAPMKLNQNIVRLSKAKQCMKPCHILSYQVRLSKAMYEASSTDITHMQETDFG